MPVDTVSFPARFACMPIIGCVPDQRGGSGSNVCIVYFVEARSFVLTVENHAFVNILVTFSNDNGFRLVRTLLTLI